MGKVLGNKLRLLYIMKIFTEETDAQHTLTLPQLLERLEKLGCTAERKSVYDDIETLREFGLNIQKIKTKTFNYYLSGKKLSDKPKASSPPGPVDLLRSALAEKCRIRFQYSHWELVPRQNGQLRPVLVWEKDFLCVHPLSLRCECGRWVLMAWDQEMKKVFSVDRMRKLSLESPGEARLVTEEQLEKVVLEVEPPVIDRVLDRFGKPESITSGKKKLELVYQLPLTEELYRHVLCLGKDVKLSAPKKAGEELRDRAKALAKIYKK